MIDEDDVRWIKNEDVSPYTNVMYRRWRYWDGSKYVHGKVYNYDHLPPTRECEWGFPVTFDAKESPVETALRLRTIPIVKRKRA